MFAKSVSQLAYSSIILLLLASIELKHQTAMAKKKFLKCTILFLLSHQFAISKAGNAARTNQRKDYTQKDTMTLQGFREKKFSHPMRKSNSDA